MIGFRIADTGKRIKLLIIKLKCNNRSAFKFNLLCQKNIKPKIIKNIAFDFFYFCIVKFPQNCLFDKTQLILFFFFLLIKFIS